MPPVPSSSPSRPVDLFLVGLGLKPAHLTAEAREAMSSCRSILYISYVPETEALLQHYCDSVVDLSGFYEAGLDRVTTYKRMAAAALEAAVSDPPVAFALYGHPLLLALPSMICLRVAPSLGLRVTALPAVSALDCIMADLGIDPVSSGVQMHEATDVLLYRRTILPESATILWQIGAMGTRLHAEGVVSLPGRLEELTSYLLRFFPADHPAYLVASSVTDSPAEVHRITLGDLPGSSKLVNVATTLYLPPAADSRTVNDALAARLTSQAYLDSVTATRDSD